MLDRVLILFALLAVAALSPVLADDDKPACFAGVHIGTGGVGAGGGCQVTEQLSLRLAVEGAGTDQSQNIDGVDYDVEAELGFTRVQLDWFPVGGGFYVSGGFANMDITVDGTADPTSPVQIGSVTVPPANLGFLEMAVRFEGVSPYLGLGWLATMGRHVSIRTEIGVSKVDEPDVSLVERETSFIPEADIQAEIDEVMAEYGDELSLFPYLKFGLEYRF